MKSITLRDVARAAGVSTITASRALGNPDRVAADTIERVRKAVEATGYVPNLLAGGLKTQRSMTVAALVPGVSVPQFLPTVQALTEEFDRAGYQMILGQVGYDRAREAALLDMLLSRRVDGIVVGGLLKRTAAVERIQRLGIPVVETWDLTDRPADMVVGFSHFEVGKAVARYFRAKGWQHVGIAVADDERAAQRLRGFQASMRRTVPAAVVRAPGTARLGREALARLLEQEPRLQAVCCGSDALAQGVLIEAGARGLRVPGQLAICGFGDAEIAATVEPPLTTVRVDGDGIGRHAARLILARCRGEAVAERVIDMGFELVERAST